MAHKDVIWTTVWVSISQWPGQGTGQAVQMADSPCQTSTRSSFSHCCTRSLITKNLIPTNEENMVDFKVLNPISEIGFYAAVEFNNH
jgi:hypothetical protein